jgi:nicotinate-nucleotide adenylyltransferase
MEFFRRAALPLKRLAVFPGAFNPVTVAHLAMAEAALAHVDEVLFVLPREFPHKEYRGASFAERIELLSAALAEEPRFSLASSAGGLFVEIAGECRQAYPEGVRLSFLCGRDAADRAAAWDYGRPEAFAEMLGSFDLMVVARGGEWISRAAYRGAVTRLELPGGYDRVSATEIRLRIARGEPWEHLAPAAAQPGIRRIYGRERRSH